MFIFKLEKHIQICYNLNKVGDKMYQYWGNVYLYTFLNDASLWLGLLFNVLILGYKERTLGRNSDILLYVIAKDKQRIKNFLNFIFIISEAWLITFAQFYLGGLNSFFGDLVGTGDNYFGTLIASPFMVSFFALLLGKDIFRLMDLITLAYPLKLILVKLACYCAGCCRGFTSPIGLYNHSTEQVEFPVQLVEMGLAAVIFIFLLFWRKKAKEGTMFPAYVTIYCATRFFSEFLRTEENIFLFLKKYHILCLIGFATGISLFYVVKKFKDRIRRFYNDFSDASENIIISIAIKTKFRKKKEFANFANYKIKDKSEKEKIFTMKRWIIIWTLGLIGQVGWNIEGTWFNTFVYEKIDKTPSIITPMLIISAVATTVSIFVFGTLTDRTGNRRNMVSFGFSVWGILLVCFSFSQFIAKNNLVLAVVYIVVMDMLLSFFGSMSTDVGYSTWLSDIMNDNNRGQIGSAIAIQVVLGSLLGNIIGGYIVGTDNNYIRLFIIIGTVLSFLGIISIFLFDKKDDVKRSVKGSYTKQLSESLNFKMLLKNQELIWIHLAVAVFFIGFNTYYPHLGNVLIQYLKYSPSQAGIIQAVPIILAMLATTPVTKLINKNRYIEVIITAIILGLFGNFIFSKITPEYVNTSKTFNLRLFTAIFIIAASYIILLQATKTWTKSLSPKGARGQYEGLWAIAYALLPMLFGSNIGELVIKHYAIDPFNEITQNYEYVPNGKVFLIGAIISAFSIIPVIVANHILKKKAQLQDQN